MINLIKDTSADIITRLVWCSGSAKGACCPGAYGALYDMGILEIIRLIAGSSAGGIISTISAVSVDPKVLRKEFLSVNFLDLLGDRLPPIEGESPKWRSSQTRDGKLLRQKIHCLVNQAISTFFETEFGRKVAYQNQAVSAIFTRLMEEKEKFALTFKELDDLHQVCPEKFKKLTLLSVKWPFGEERVCNSTLTPNFGIAKAAYASSAIPGILEPVVERIDGQDEILIDGGLYELLPSEYFDLDPNGLFKCNEKPQQTLLFDFADHPEYEKSSGYKAIYTNQESPLYTPGIIEGLIRDYGSWLSAGFEGSYKNTERRNWTYEKLRSNYRGNTVILRVGAIMHHEFDKATILGREMCAIAYLDTVFHCIGRNLHRNSFNQKEFFLKLKLNFDLIYYALLSGSGKWYKEDSFHILLENQENKLKMQLIDKSTWNCSKHLCQFINEFVADRLDSFEGFALCRALELTNRQIDHENLLLETYFRSLKSPERLTTGLDMSILFGVKNQEDRFQLPIFQQFVEQPKTEDECKRINKIVHYLKQIPNSPFLQFVF